MQKKVRVTNMLNMCTNPGTKWYEEHRKGLDQIETCVALFLKQHRHYWTSDISLLYFMALASAKPRQNPNQVGLTVSHQAAV